MHPILFRFGSLPIGTYGVLIVTGMLAALWLTGRLARRCGLSVEFFYDLIFILLLAGFGGGRALYIVQNWDEFTAAPLSLLFSRQGFVFQGGFIAALAAALILARVRRIPFFAAADVAAPALALAHGFGRIGCFFAGCCFGRACPPATSGWLARTLSVQYPGPDRFPGFDFAYQGQLAAGLIPATARLPLPILPVQLFEAAGNFLICLVLLWAWRRRRFSGRVFALYMLLYAILRFSLEFLRGDAERRFYLGVPTGQWLAILTLICGLTIWALRRNKGLEAVPVPVPVEEQPLPAPAPKKTIAPAGKRHGR